MKKISITLLICIATLVIIFNNNCVQAAEEDNFEEDQLDALSFLVDKRAYKQFKTTCEEHKREAKAAYELRCEPSITPRSTSNEFLRRKRGIFHPGLTACEEQKREAREDYEERCEPSIPWQRDRNSNRFCPDINDWYELDSYEIGEGGGFDFDTLGKLIPQNMSMEKIIGGVVAGIITAGVGGKRRAAHANRFLKRTFFHPGATKCEEQKREAREDYEERCEPSFPLFRNTGTRRFCPDIHDWKEFDNYEIGDGYDSRDLMGGDKKNTGHNKERNQYERTNDRNQYNRNNDRNHYNTISDRNQYNTVNDKNNYPTSSSSNRNNDYDMEHVD
ncbi:unnamed protein product [Adineta steineri]|uniref:Uncharacterized protein n=1 Tax=Adineta steineri TaxID=433720 RepID=A0A814PXC5_9BILA|nr:unnamed protein product [Adineta steineri]